MRKLNLNRDRADQCIQTAARIVSSARKYIDRHSTRAIEVATLQCLGLTGTWKGRLLADGVVSNLTKEELRSGSAFWWGRALVHGKGTPAEIAEQVIRGKMDLKKLPETPFHQIRDALPKSLPTVSEKRGFGKRNGNNFSCAMGLDTDSWRKVLAAAQNKGVERIYVWPRQKEAGYAYLEAEGKESWPARLQNFSKERPGVSLVPVLMGLHIPEIAAQISKLSVSGLGLDAFANVFHYKISPQKSFVDQHFVFSLSRWMQIPLETAGFLWIKNRCQKSHEILAHLLLQEQFSVSAGRDLKDLGLSASLVESPDQNLISNFAQIQVCREVFSQARLQMIAESDSAENLLLLGRCTFQDGLFFVPGQERLITEVAEKKNLYKDLGDALEFSLHGQVAREAHNLLDLTWKYLKQMEDQTFWKYFEAVGSFSQGQEELIQVERRYFNPIRESLWRVSESS